MPELWVLNCSGSAGGHTASTESGQASLSSRESVFKHLMMTVTFFGVEVLEGVFVLQSPSCIVNLKFNLFL